MCAAEEAAASDAGAALRASFAQDGFVYVRRCVDEATLDALLSQCAAELERPSVAAESGGESLLLHQPDTWPRGDARRVLEVTPPGEGDHWRRLVSSPPLVSALDALLGVGNWELPVNCPAPEDGGRVAIRHWYAPVVFPDAPGGGGETDWAPVNRRGERWRGWHVDIGPGFDTDAARTSEGHPAQGVVVLLLGGDWAAGCGGTALARGSHRWVASALRHAGGGGVSHQQLNTWCAAEAAARREAGRLDLCQACGQGGDVVLMHPWLVHSGTCNGGA